MAIQGGDIADVVVAVRRAAGPPKWISIAENYTDYLVMPKLFKKGRVSKVNSGYGCLRQIMTGTSGAAKNVGLYQTEDPNVANQLTQMNVPFRHTRSDYSFDRVEMKMAGSGRSGNGREDGQALLDLLKVRRYDAMLDLAEKFETNFASAPTDPADNLSPYGLPYWIVSSTTQGFNGTVPSGGFTDVGGVNPTTYPAWTNYTDAYDDVSESDMIRKISRARYSTQWKPPVKFPRLDDQSRRHMLLTDLETVLDFEEKTRSNNDNLGTNVGKYEGMTTFSRTPIEYWPKLDDSSLNRPFYILDMATFHTPVLRGEYMREMTCKPDKYQPSVTTTYIDTSYNFLCINRRRNSLIIQNS